MQTLDMKRGSYNERPEGDFHTIDAIADYFDNELTLEKNRGTSSINGVRRETVMEERSNFVAEFESIEK